MNKCKLLISAFILLFVSCPVYAEFNWGKALSSAIKTYQAMTITDAQMAEYVKESVKYMDANNKVLPSNSPYVIRLGKLTKGITQADGIPLNFKVYQVNEANAFACPDGSVRVFTGIMDMMDDDELLGIIGHEIGHVMKHHSKNALKNELLTGALRDAISSTGGKVAALTDSQLGDISQSLMSAKFSRKQEQEADDCGYDFLVKNGKNPWGMVMAFEKMDAQGGGSKSNFLTKMFSSHPDTKARIKKMTERAQKDGYKRPEK